MDGDENDYLNDMPVDEPPVEEKEHEQFPAEVDGMVRRDTPEAWREYVYPDGVRYKISGPRYVYIKDKPNGLPSHRVVDTNGLTHYLVPGWRILRWDGDVAF